MAGKNVNRRVGDHTKPLTPKNRWFYLTLDNIEPRPKERVRFSSRSKSFYTPHKTRAFEDEIQTLARALWKHDCLDGPLRVNVNFYFASSKDSHVGHHAVKPDLDNVIKSTFDSLNRIVWWDDREISECTAKKRWRSYPGIAIEIYTMSNDH